MIDLRFAAALMAAQASGAMIAISPGYSRSRERDEPIRLGVDLAGPDGDLTTVALVDRDGDMTRVRSVMSEPAPSNRNPADQEALRAAQLRRERKIARQAKGFR
jgi:hypothetical protein